MTTDTYEITPDPKHHGKVLGCIDLCESVDDGGWYANQYDFTREDSATRTSASIYTTRDALLKALNSGKHRWANWS